MDTPQQPQQVQIKANENIIKGTYSTHMQVAHSQEEFILDFINLFPPQATLVSRVIVTPSHFKRIINALVDNLKKYEQKFGTIKQVKSEAQDKEIGFKVGG